MSEGKPKGKGGRKPFKPTDKDRAYVRSLVAYGIRQEEICSVMGISRPTLRKYFRRELDVSGVEANAKVAESLFKIATSGGGAQAVTAQIFWLKCRAGWKPVDVHEITGRDGRPIEMINGRMDVKAAAEAYAKTLEDDA